MTSVKTIETKTSGLDETLDFGQIVGRLLESGSVLGLYGDLGCGKTVFVKGLAAGLAVADVYIITSPTYTLINEYPGRLPLYHVDLYRIQDAEEIEMIGLFDIMAGCGVTAIEWAERIAEQLPGERLDIRFDIIDDNTRRITLTGFGRHAALLAKLTAYLES